MYVPEIQFYSTDVLPGIMKNCKKNEQDFSSFRDDFFLQNPLHPERRVLLVSTLHQMKWKNNH